MKTVRRRIILPALLVIFTLPFLPMGLPVFKAEGLVKYYSFLEKKFGMTMGRRFEDNSIHSLPQDYADMIGWEQLTRVADSAWKMIENKSAAFIYAENYGEAAALIGSITNPDSREYGTSVYLFEDPVQRFSLWWQIRTKDLVR